MSARVLSLVAAAVLALAMAAGAVLLVLASDHEDNKAATIALAVTAGLSFVASGLVALWRRPENHTGYLLAAVGYVWFLGALSESNNDWLFTLGSPLGSLAFGVFAHLLLAFPGGRLTSRRDLWIVVATYVLVGGGTVAAGVLSEHPDPMCTTCRSTLAIGTYEGAYDAIDAVASVLALALLATLLIIVVGRFVRARGALRRALGPVLGAGTVVMLVLVLEIAVDSYSAGAAAPLEYVFLAAFATVPLAFLVGVLRSRLARSAVGDLVLALDRGHADPRCARGRARRPHARDRVLAARAGRYVSAEGKELPERPEGRAMTLVGTPAGRRPRSSTIRWLPTSRNSSRRSPPQRGSGSTTSGYRPSCVPRSSSSRRSSTPPLRCSARSIRTGGSRT